MSKASTRRPSISNQKKVVIKMLGPPRHNKYASTEQSASKDHFNSEIGIIEKEESTVPDTMCKIHGALMESHFKNAQLMTEMQMQRLVAQTSAEMVQLISAFYSEAFREIGDSFGFDLARLNTIRSVLSED